MTGATSEYLDAAAATDNGVMSAKKCQLASKAFLSEGPRSDIDRYSEYVRLSMVEAKLIGRPSAFENRGTPHARAVLSTMIDNADSSVCIFARRLRSDVHDADRIKAFISRHPDKIVRIVVEEPNPLHDPDSALAKLQDEVASGKIELKVLDHRRVPDHLDRDNICIVDGLHVRRERDQEARKANVFFADPCVAEKETSRFDAIANLAEPYINQ
jgi:hypothetical protein